MPIAEQEIKSAIRYLRKQDAVLAEIIKRVGPCKINTKRNRFLTLVRSIISQQISVAAARTINKRLVDLVSPATLNAKALCKFSVDDLRAAGVSRQKASYILDLSDKVHSGVVNLRKLSRMSNEEVVEKLILVKGVGVWTAQMFLMFSLGRLDVLPTGDLGIQNAMKKNYRIRGAVNPARMEKIASNWAPYRTIGCYYMWQSLELD